MGFTKTIYFLNNLPNTKLLEKMIALTLKRITVDSDTCIFLSGRFQKDKVENSLYYIKEGMAKFYLNHTMNY